MNAKECDLLGEPPCFSRWLNSATIHTTGNVTSVVLKSEKHTKKKKSSSPQPHFVIICWLFIVQVSEQSYEYSSHQTY